MRITIGAWLLTLAFAGNVSAGEMICGTLFNDKTEAHSRLAAKVRLIKISKAMGDLYGMIDAYNAIKSDFSGCLPKGGPVAEEFRSYCAYDCHTQLVEYNLFMANGIEYFFSKATPNPQDAKMLLPESLAAFVTEGLKVLESGEALLGANLGDSMQEDGFKGYLYKAGLFNLLKARMYMAQGDIWYKNVSERRIQRLLYITDSLDGPVEDDGKESELSLARTYYRKAMWGLMEAVLEIPQEAFFDAIYLQADEITGELNRRQDSVERGLLFIGIDPDEQKLLKIADYEVDLEQLGNRIQALESKIDENIRAFQERLAAGKITSYNNQDEYQNYSISLSAHKVGVLEIQTEAQNNELKQKLQGVSTEISAFEREKLRAEFLFQMKQNLAELNKELAALENRKEVEIIDFERRNVEHEINELRYMISYEQSTNNLEMQVQSLEGQIFQLEQEKRKHTKTLEQIDLQAQEIVEENAQLEARIQSSDLQIQEIETRRTEVFDASVQSIAADVCELETRLFRLDGTTSPAPSFDWPAAVSPCVIDTSKSTQQKYLKEKCSLQNSFKQAQIQTMADVLICVIGTELLPESVKQNIDKAMPQYDPSYSGLADYRNRRCNAVLAQCQSALAGAQIDPASPELKQKISCNQLVAMSQEVFAQKMRLAKQRIDGAEANLGKTIELMDILKSKFILSIEGKAVALAAALTAGKAAKTTIRAAVSGVPAISTGALAGMAGGPIMLEFTWMKVLNDAERSVSEINEALEMMKTVLDVEEFAFEKWAEWKKMEKDIDDLRQVLRQVRIEKDLEAIAAVESFVELTNRSLNAGADLQATLFASEMEKLDCDNQAIDLSFEAAQLIQRRASLVARARSAVLENNLLEKEIKRVELDKDVSRSGIAINLARLEERRIERDKVLIDIEAIDGGDGKVGMIARYRNQIDKLQQLIALVVQSYTEDQKKTMLLATLNEQSFKKSIIGLDAQMGAVQAVILNNQSHTEEMRNLLANLAERELLSEDVSGDMIEVYENLYGKVLAEKQKMLDSSERLVKSHEGDKEQEVFLSSQEVIANLVNGIPEFIAAKKRLLEVANLELVLLKNRIKAVSTLIDANVTFGLEDPDPILLVRTGDDLLTAVDGLKRDVLAEGSGQFIRAEAFRINIPAGSGFARELASTRAVRFEITPAARRSMNDYGYYALWSERFDYASAPTLIDMNLKINFTKSNCAERRYTLVHEGMGFKFANSTDYPIFVSGESRRDDAKAYYSQSSDDKIKTVLSFWDHHYASVMDFLRGRISAPDFAAGDTLPLLGLPVLGTYQIRLPHAADSLEGGSGSESECTYNNASFELILVYAKPVVIDE